MKLEDFIQNCNKSPFFKRNGILITEEILNDFNFIKEDYDFPKPDLSDLINKFSDFILPFEPKELEEVYGGKEWSNKLLHKGLIKRIYNQKLIAQCRKDLNMPFHNRGFNLSDIPAVKRFPAIVVHFTNVNFEFIEPAFKEWFFSFAEKRDYCDELDKLEKTTPIVYEKLNAVVSKVLETWKLSKLYREAIIELIIFNRIIPSSLGISWTSVIEKDGTKKEAIIFPENISKSELIRHINLYYRKKKSKNEHRTPRKGTETEKIVELYNSIRSTKAPTWRMRITDKEIFEEIHKNHYPKLSVRVIQKRIKGY